MMKITCKSYDTGSHCHFITIGKRFCFIQPGGHGANQETNFVLDWCALVNEVDGTHATSVKFLLLPSELLGILRARIRGRKFNNQRNGLIILRAFALSTPLSTSTT